MSAIAGQRVYDSEENDMIDEQTMTKLVTLENENRELRDRVNELEVGRAKLRNQLIQALAIIEARRELAAAERSET